MLDKGETLSSFVEESLRRHIGRRKLQREFLDRGLAAGSRASETGRYASREDVMTLLRTLAKKVKTDP